MTQERSDIGDEASRPARYQVERWGHTVGCWQVWGSRKTLDEARAIIDENYRDGESWQIVETTQKVVFSYGQRRYEEALNAINKERS